MHRPGPKEDERTEPPGFEPANIIWRIIQGVLDDLIITGAALGLSWMLGILPSSEQFKSADSISSLTQMIIAYLPLTARIGSIFFIHAGIKFIYYVAFIAATGQTPACYLLRLRIVMVDGNPASVSSAVKRAIAGGIVSHTPVIGYVLRLIDYLATLFNPRKQAVRDMVARTMLVHVSRSRGFVTQIGKQMPAEPEA
jgi:uncharacterized RDD family membrane protein YckC